MHCSWNFLFCTISYLFFKVLSILFKLELFKELVFCAIIDPFIMDNIEYI
jgi:hypothetical protein